MSKNKPRINIGIEMFRKVVKKGIAGDNVGLLLKDIKKNDIQKEDLIAEQNSIKLYRIFNAEVHVL